MADHPAWVFGFGRQGGCIFNEDLPTDAADCPGFVSHATAQADPRQQMPVALLACRREPDQPIDAIEQRVLPILPNLAKPLEQVPGGLVRDAQIPVQFHARQAAAESGVRMHRQCPDPVAEIGTLHDRPRAHTEPLAAAAAAVGHGLVLRPLLDAERPAMRAGFLSLPSLPCEPAFSGALSGNSCEAACSALAEWSTPLLRNLL